ncbi:aspartate/glutamate racemase family protein [Endozoicomonadaceae bacterium StTr2]
MPVAPVTTTSKTFVDAQIPGMQPGKGVNTTCFLNGRSVRKLKLHELPDFYSVRCHKPKSRLSRIFFSLVTLGKVRYRNIKINMVGGRSKTVAINVQHLAKQFDLSPTQRRILLKGQTDLQRSAVLTGILEQKIGCVSDLLQRMKPKPGENPAAWANDLLNKNSILEGNNYCQEVLPLELDPDQVDYYCALQHAIAQRLPKESHRPTIDLNIIGSKARQEGVACSLGILGGVGPLSDAEITRKTFSNLKNVDFSTEHLRVNVFSCPPPRDAQEKIVDGPEYLANIKRFANRNHEAYVVACNTAHVNFNKIRQLGLWQAKHTVNHLCQKIHDDNPKATGVLVLGTKQAYDKKLYPLALNRKGVKALPISSEQEQAELQDIINATKAKGDTSEKERLYELTRRQIENARKQNKKVSHVLLGCTELPMALGPEYMKKLEQEFGVKAVDTETEFAKIFSEILLQGQGHPMVRS